MRESNMSLMFLVLQVRKKHSSRWGIVEEENFHGDGDNNFSLGKVDFDFSKER